MASKKSSVACRSQAGAKSVSSPPPDWEALFQAIPDPAMILGPDFSILHVNRATQQATGLSEQELKGRPCYEIFHDASRPPQGCPMAEVIASGRGGTAELEVEILKGAYRVACAPGLDKNGNIQNIIHLASDITERKRAEDAKRQAEIRYRSLFEQTHDAIFILDLEGRHLDANQRAAEMLGYTRNEILKLSYADTSTQLQESRQVMKRLHAGEHIPVYERIFRKKNGELVPAEINVELVRDADGQPLHIQSVVRDVTARKQAEDELRIAEANYRSIFENATVGIYQSTPQGRFLSVNPAMARIYGYDSAQEMMASVTDIARQVYAHPSDRQEFQRPLAEYGEVVEFIGQNRRKDGSLIWTQTNSRAEKDAQGNILYYEGFITDISERKRIENELRESEEKYRRLVELSPDLIAIHSEGKICFANQAGLRLVGADRLDQMVGKPTLEFVAPGLRAQIAKRIQHALQNGVVLPFLDEKFVRLDGSEVDVSVTAVPTTWQGKPAMQVIARDITERKLAENEVRGAKDALESAHRELQQSLEREQLLARTDDLTDLYNRRYFFKHAAREFRDALHYKRPLSIIMFDVDGFKRINDSFGHLTGDKALALVAQVTAAQVRAIDVLARYGGDEFVVLLPQTGAQQALAIAERIRVSVAASRLKTDRGAIALTLSMGIAEIIHTFQDESVESVIRRADEAMYNAKQAGLNRIVISEK